MNSWLLRLTGSASAKTCSGAMLCGLQSRVTSRSWSGCVAAWLDSGAMSPREQNPGVQALGWQVPSGGTAVGAGQTCAARAGAGTRLGSPHAATSSALPILLYVVVSWFGSSSSEVRMESSYRLLREDARPPRGVSDGDPRTSKRGASGRFDAEGPSANDS